jgi:hypothetical protein
MDPSSGLAGEGIFANQLILLDLMVGERGFEPPTPWSRTRCSTRLSHSPNMGCRSASVGARPGAFVPRMHFDQCSRIRNLTAMLSPSGSTTV